MSDSDKPEIEIAPFDYSVTFPCPECGERLWVFFPTDGSNPEVVRARDIPSDDDVIDDDSDDAETGGGSE